MAQRCRLGIGAVPDSVLQYLEGKKDLGIHTELFSDGVMRLVEKGVITGARKTLHPGKITAGFVLGSRDLYQLAGPQRACRAPSRPSTSMTHASSVRITDRSR